jgi:hypothetical protein
MNIGYASFDRLILQFQSVSCSRFGLKNKALIKRQLENFTPSYLSQVGGLVPQKAN